MGKLNEYGKNFVYDPDALRVVAGEAELKAKKIVESMEKGMGANDVNAIDSIMGMPKMKRLHVIDSSYPRKKFVVLPSNKVELPKNSIKRHRFVGRWFCKVYEDQDVTAAYCAGFYHNALQRAGIVLDIDVRDLCREKKLAKEVSDAAFLYGDAFDVYWRYLCHIKRLQDYKSRVSPELFADEVNYWLTPKQHWWFGDEERFYAVFSEHLERHFASLQFVKPAMYDVSYIDWIKNRTNWANSGSGFSKIRVVEKNNDVKKTKWYDAWSMTDEQLIYAFENQQIAYNRVLQKPEIEKVRAIVGSDLITYMRMKYTWDTTLSGFYKRWGRCPVFMNDYERISMWRTLAKDKDWKIPLDQSEFDQMQSRRCIMLCYKKIKNMLIDVDSPATQVWDWLLQSMEDSIVELVLVGLKETILDSVRASDLTPEVKQHVIESIQKGVVEWEWTNGVLSGWFLTAYTDTLMNDITKRMAEEWVLIVSGLGSDNITIFFCQGDDDAISTLTYVYACLLSLAYASMGYKVNRAKFYISRTRHEFLRKTISPDRIDGYPARSVTNLLFASPEREITGSTDVAASRLSMWHKFSNRLACDISKLPYIADIIGATSWKKADVILWLTTPRPLGGGGVLESPTPIWGIPEIKIDKIGVEKVKTTAIWESFKSEFRVVDDTLYNQTMVSKKPVKKIAIVEKVRQVDLRMDSNKVEVIDGNMLIAEPADIPHYRYEPAIGKLGKYTEFDPINKHDIDCLTAGFTRGLRSEFVDGLTLKAPFCQGYSEEIASFLTRYYLRKVFLRLCNKHRATLFDFRRYNLRVNSLPLRVDFVMAE